MSEIIEWIKNNYKDVATLLCAVIAAASFVVKFTPSVKDNGFLKKVINFLDKISIFQTAENQKYIDDAKKNVETEKEESK